MISRLFRRNVLVRPRLTLELLEERIVMDAAPVDAGNAETDHPNENGTPEDSGGNGAAAPRAAGSDPAQSPSESSDPLGYIFDHDLSVVLISNALDQVEALSEAAVNGAEVVVYDAQHDDLSAIVETLGDLVDSTGQEIGHLAILSHGSVGTLALGNGELWTVEALQNNPSEWNELGGLLAEDAVIDLYGCSIGQGEEGVLFVHTLASLTDATVRASDDTTGNVEDADWDFEVTTGHSDAASLIDDSLLENGTIRLDDFTVDAGETYTGDLIGTSAMDTITINGTVTGNVDAGAGSDVVENNGTVGGNVNGGDHYDTITNNGYIGGDFVGGGSEDLIVNHGTVAGTIYGVSESDTITNTGYAYKIAGQGGDDTIVTSGDVATDIKAGGGNDTVSWYGGDIGGEIDGQRGNDDVLNLYVPAGTVSYSYSGTAASGSLTYDGETVKWKGFETLNVIPPSAATTTAYDDLVTIDEDHDISFDVLANDTVSDTGGSLTVVSIDTSTMHFPDNLEEVANGQYIYHEFSTTGHIDHDYLAVGETATETFTYTMEDEEGVASTAEVTITFTGLNDDPQLRFNNPKDANANGFVTENDGDPLTYTGYYYIVDIDTTNTHTTAFSYNGDAVWSGGTLTSAQITTLTAGFSVDDGDLSDRYDQSWTYTVANADVAFLASGETVVFSYDLTVEDNDGGVSFEGDKTVTITIYGAGSAASISGDDTGSLTEDDATTQVSGTLTVTDPDTGEDVFQVVASADLQGTYGAFTFDDSTGDWTYTIDNSDPDTDALTQGQIVTDSLTVTSADGTATETIEVTITGANDAASISGTATGSLTEDDATTQVSGALTVTDPDTGEDVFQTVASTDLQGTYGAFTFDDSTGDWTYTIDNSDPDTDALTQGQIVTDSLTVTSVDGTATETIEVTITGANDAASISGTATGSLNEDDATTQVSGALTVTDPDTGEDVFQAVAAADLQGTYGAFTFDDSTGDWTYTIDNSDPDTDALTQGQIVTDSLTVTSVDGTATETIEVTITGANDAASISGTATGSLNEDDATTLASGSLTITDPDSGEDVFQAVASADLQGTYGAFTFDDSTGDWTYTIDNNDPDTDALTQGQIVTDSLTVTSADGTATETIEVTITGANDAASISGTATGSLTEDDATTQVNGTLTVTDPDTGEDVFQAVASADLQGTYGAFTFDDSTGDWTYTIDNSDPDTDALTQGQIVTDSLTVTSADGTATETIEVTVAGANDAPTSADNAVTTYEDVSFTFQTTDFPFNDVDTGATLQWVEITDLPDEGTLFWNGSVVGLNDRIPISDIAGGGLVYEPGLNGNGAPYTDFGFQVSDGIENSASSYTMTINVAAVNDAPEISAPSSVALSEDSSLAISGISVSDVDVDEGNGQVEVTLSASHGTLTLGATNGLTFDPSGADGTSNVSFRGSLADVNDALSAVTYSPYGNFHGTDTVQILVDDLGNYGSPGPRINNAEISVTVTDVIDYTPVYDELSIETPSSEGFSSTVGHQPLLGEVFSLVESRGLLPHDLTSQHGGEQSGVAHTHVWSQLFDALDEESRTRARHNFNPLIQQETSSAEGDIWLGLAEFMARTKDWLIGKDTEDLRLVFNAGEIKLAEWFNGLISSEGHQFDTEGSTSPELGEHGEKSASGRTLVFHMDELKVADLFTMENDTVFLPIPDERIGKSDSPQCRMFDLNELSLLDALAG